MAEAIKRKLTTILAADVAGYSRLMSIDEEATLNTLMRHREIIDGLISTHDGRIFGASGDSVIAEFASAVESVRCAIAVQEALKTSNAVLAAARQMKFRIGVNVGDVMVEDDNLYGDGVNVAARLEGLATAGGICISGSTFDLIKNKLPISFEDMGPQEVKNIAQPVQAYAIGAEGEYSGAASSNATGSGDTPTPKSSIIRYASFGLILAGVLAGAGWYWQNANVTGASPSTTAPATSAAPATTAAITAAERAALSILVLPFANGTGDPQQDYIADGLTASITSDLLRIRDAFVVATATAFTYKNKPVDLRQLGADQGVRFVLQGNVQRSGDTIRINTQLADTQTNAQLWAETFEGDSSNLFALQDQVTARIGNSIGREMVILAARENETRITNPQAADFILRAAAGFLKPRSLETYEQIENWCRQALELDPQNAEAMTSLGWALVVQAFNFGRKLPPDVKEKKFVEGRDYALKAKELDPNNPRLYGILALYYTTHDDFPAFQRATETWLSLDPKNPKAYNFEANTQIYLGRYQKAIELLNLGSALDPKHPSVLLAISYFRAYFLYGDNESTIEWAQRALELNPRFSESHVFLAMAHALNGDDAKAREAADNLRRLNPKFKLTNFRKPQSTRPAAHNDAYSEKLLPAGRKAGLPE